MSGKEPKVTLNLDNINLDDVVRKAIFQSLDEKVRNELGEKAIEYLTEQSGYGYNSKSPLTDAYETAVRKVCNEVVMQHVESSTEFKEKIKAIILASMNSFVQNCTTEIIQGIARKVSGSIVKEYRDD